MSYFVSFLLVLFLISPILFFIKIIQCMPKQSQDQIDLMQNNKVKRQIEIKKKLSEKNSTDSSESQSSDNNNNSSNELPKGNKFAKNWIVLDLGVKPTKQEYDLQGMKDDWGIKFFGVQTDTNSYFLKVSELKNLGLQEYTCDWHCVTGWSTKNLQFKGVPLALLLQHIKPQQNWVCLWQVGADSYTVNVHKDDIQNAFVAIYDENDQLISDEHGGVRIVFPSLFGWKSAKWLKEVHFLKQHQNGFWEKLYCHPRGRIQFNERWHQKAEGVWNTLIYLMSLYQYILPYDQVVRLMQVSGAVLGWCTLRLKYLKEKNKDKDS